MDKVIVYTQADGTLSVIAPGCRGLVDVETQVLVDDHEFAPLEDGTYEKRKIKRAETQVTQREETDEEYIARIEEVNTEVLKGRTWRWVSRDKMPDTAEFRGAWTDEFDTDTVDIDITRAKDIKKERQRAARAPAFAQLDVEAVIASEKILLALEQQLLGEDGNFAKIVELKQAFRDAPADPRIDAAETVEDLQAISLPEMKQP